MKLTVKKRSQEGDLSNVYAPFNNILKNGMLTKFRTKELEVDFHHPLQVDCQPSYDGSVNLIINDDKNPPRIINSRFTKIENNRFRIITRNQKQQTNIYNVNKIDQQTRLFRTLNTMPKVQLYNVGAHGQLKGGNYVFYIKFGDGDDNRTNFVAESGVVSIFNGTDGYPKTVSGTLADERTNKNIRLKIKDIDTSFSKLYLYYTRSTSDLNGFRVEESAEFTKAYDIAKSEMIIDITGFEEITQIPESEINVQYLYADAVKTQTQVQNRLFFGNIESVIPDNTTLQQLSYQIQVECTNNSSENEEIGYVDLNYNSDIKTALHGEYYNTQNIYYRLGYWPEEMYRLGIVYVKNDDTLTDVYNLRGVDFNKVGSTYKNFTEVDLDTILPNEEFLDYKTYSNTFGIFRNPKFDVIQDNTTKPIFYKMSLSKEVQKALKDAHVKGFFFVRQKRIPTTLGQGLEIGINSNCYVPMIYGDKNKYIAESFKGKDNTLITNFDARLLESESKQSSGLLCLDALINPTLQSTFNGQKFILTCDRVNTVTKKNRRYLYNCSGDGSSVSTTAQLLYVDENTPSKGMGDYYFCTKAGDENSVSEITFWNPTTKEEYLNSRAPMVRGIYTGFIGTNANLKEGAIYNIKTEGYDESFLKEYFEIRGKDNAPFYAISDRISLYDDISENFDYTLNVYRGDCYVNTVTMRINRNFTDPDVPIDDIIVKEDTWKKNYKGYLNAVYTNGRQGDGDKTVNALQEIALAITGETNSSSDDDVTKFYKINRADVNAVPLGLWVTYKCLSNYNLSLRSIDRTHTDEMALLGNARSFYPFNSLSTKSAYKCSESALLNDGYSSTVGKRVNFKYADVPYIKDQFDNRIMFSNIQINDRFKNGYRIFQGLSYQDIDRQYGAIVKLLPWIGNGSANLLAVFEHGIGIVPVNEKALMQTTTGQNVHLYGAGVLQSDISVISDCIGSTWEDSIIKTPLAIYGVDTYAKKIWKLPLGGSYAFESISDMHIQRFLNDHITFEETDKTPIIGLRNVKTHYNNFKGDVMFTFYDDNSDESWNICYNERTGKWITRYSWTPLLSENINNIFFSFDQKRVKPYAYIYENQNTTHGLRSNNYKWISNTPFETTLSLVGYNNAENIIVKVDSISTSYLDSDGVEQFVTKTNNNIFTVSGSGIEKTMTLNQAKLQSEFGFLPYYLILNLLVTPTDATLTKHYLEFATKISIIRDVSSESEDVRNEFKQLLQNSFFVHGRAGNFDEIDYWNESLDDQILPTKWYCKQEPFEFEFVVNDAVGLHKIFNNLVIISNNVKPDSLQFEIEGDVYNFNKAGLYWDKHCPDGQSHEFDEKYNPSKTTVITDQTIKYWTSQEFDNTDITWDNNLNSFGLEITQPCKDITKYGRLNGNIHYKEDSWYSTIDPIKFKRRCKIEGRAVETGDVNSTRIRDKYCKIRVKYTGKDLVIITALKTLYTLSFS